MNHANDNTNELSNNSVRRGIWLLVTGFGLYSVIALSLSAAGFFTRTHVNIFPITVTIATIALSASYFLSPSIRTLCEKLGPYGLAYFHIWRILAGVVFLYYGAQNWLPDIFVSLAGWGDILAGILAAVVMLLPRSLQSITVFHLIGFTDFVVAVGTGIVLNAIAPESMLNIVLLPIAAIPLIGVPLSGATHIAALHMLWTSRNNHGLSAQNR